MLATDELRALIANHESDRVELTTSTKKTDKFGEAICAFANDFSDHRQPGYLIVGVDDTGRVGGLTVGDELLRSLGNLRSNVNIEPLPAMTVQKYSLPEGEVAVVEVLPSDLPPVRYKGRVWIRVGPSRRGANQQEERILIEKRTALQRSFDVRPCQGCTIDDIIMDLFLVTYLPAAVDRSVIDENNRAHKDQPGAWIQFVRWAGATMVDDPIGERLFSGDLITVLREIEAFVSLPAQLHPVADSTLRERTVADYPPVAIRELLLNAIMHRSYETNAPVDSGQSEPERRPGSRWDRALRFQGGSRAALVPALMTGAAIG